MSVEPIPDERAALVETDGTRLLVLADYHAGIESVLRADGVEIDSQAASRRARVLDLLAETGADRLVILGDFVHAIGDPWESERDELEALFDAITVPVTLLKGNHDGEIEPFLDGIDHDITVGPPGGLRIGAVGFLHGHTWPTAAVLGADIVCVGHEHPVVRLEDSVGGARHEEVWLRGSLVPAVFSDAVDTVPESSSELVVFPVFNEQSGGMWVNVEGQEFLSPFLPEGIEDEQAYLLDGTRLGTLETI